MTPEPHRDPEPIEHLLGRLHAGDHAAVPAVLRLCGPMIRRRIRGRMSRDMRRVMDSDDIFSTLARRLEIAVSRRRIRASTPPELLSFIGGLSERTLLEKYRWVTRMRRLESTRHPPGSPDPGIRSGNDVEHAITVAIAALPAESDRTLAQLRLIGTSHRTIAETLGISVESSRRRWRSLRLQLIAALRAGA